MTQTAPAPATARHRPGDPLGDPVFAERYRAMRARDARFDGQFITGVHSTGIYCRPSCPAVSPKPTNVSFYLTAAAAHEAGLRACKRCLPDAVPGSPEWDLRDDLAARAMRLIADGVVEREGVPGLAARLGYTTRHLTRVVTAELGAGPLALARAHRAQTARVLLTSTAMPAADVAFASGFGSVRQFNETIREVYDRSPLELRAAARARERVAHRSRAAATAPGVVHLRLPARPPFDAAGVFAWLEARAVAGVEVAAAGRFQRTLRLPGGPALVEFGAGGDAGSPAIDVDARLATLADLPPLVARVRRLFDLDADAVAIDEALGADPVLAPSVAAAPGIRVPGCLDPHELVFRALIGQQVSVKAARTALTRLAADLGDQVGIDQLGVDRFDGLGDPGRPAGDGASARLRTCCSPPPRPSPSTVPRCCEGRQRACARSSTSRGGSTRASSSWRPSASEKTCGSTSSRCPASVRGPRATSPCGSRAHPTCCSRATSRCATAPSDSGLPGSAAELDALGARWAPWRSYASMHLWRAAGAPA